MSEENTFANLLESDFLDFFNYDNSDDTIPCSSTSQQGRFVPVSIDQLDVICKNRIPKSTRDKTAWCMRLFTCWLNEWRCRLDNVPKVLKMPEDMNQNELDYCLKFFVAELRKPSDGIRYPPRTLKEIFAGIQHHFNNVLMKPFSVFLDKEFVNCRSILDAEMKKSAQDGNVKVTKRAAAISIDIEDTLWDNGAFGWSNPKQLLSTLIYHIGLHFALRANQEHRDLLFGDGSQITLVVDKNTGVESLQYVERCSKNRHFGIKQSRLEPKVTYAYPNVNKHRCLIEIYKKYVSHRPESNGLSGCTAFYLTPLTQPNGEVWFKCLPVGVNTISSTLKNILKQIPGDRFYSNTSLRRTAKTRLVESGLPREIVAKKTGHLSTADITYVESSNYSEQNMSNVLYGINKGSAVEKVSLLHD